MEQWTFMDFTNGEILKINNPDDARQKSIMLVTQGHDFKVIYNKVNNK